MHVKINSNIILVGTAHISKDSVEEVKKIIQEEKPDIVAIELCERRYKAITEKEKWENTPVKNLLKSNNAYLMLSQTFLSSIQRKLGKDHGVEPGSEMIAAMKEAEKEKIDVALVDRDITISWEFMKAIIGFDEEEIEELDLEELMDQDMISTLMEEFGKIAPSVSTVLIKERDQYLAKRILEESQNGKKIVAVIGAGHLQGIQKYLQQSSFDVDLKELEHIPKKRIKITKIVAYMIPILFVGLIAGLLYFKGETAYSEIKDILLWWILINGSLSALGAAIARGHPLTIGAAFLAAPLTSLNPAVAAGWIAGYVEAKVRSPVVKDFKQLRELEGLRDFWNNRVIRLLLVVAFSNLGSMFGTFIAGGKIIQIVFG